MSAREALQIQLDAVTAEKNVLEAENLRLKETRPERAAVIEAEKQLTQVRKELTEKQEENARLAVEMAQLKTLYEQLLRGTREAEVSTVSNRRCTELESEVNDLKIRFESEKERVDAALERESEMTIRCEQLEQEARDDYAQELKKLFAKAYTRVAHGRSETEEMDQIVLSIQFVCRLCLLTLVDTHSSGRTL